jgi:crotonobetainyl-CoA:carnitine CoA-transferase CaiB-like acyl-CoA transferase
MEPLADVRIVEITTAAAGPLATGILANQGADVIRLETIEGDVARYAGGVRGGVTGYFAHMNGNKRSAAVDIKDRRIQKAIYELIKTTDVFVQNSRPGALERAGFGYDKLHEINPDLIYVSISGFGRDGPGAEARVYDPVIQAVSGLAFAQATDDGAPVLVKSLVSDKVTAYTAAQAISSALFARAMNKIGGHHIELSMLDASLAFLWTDNFWNHGFVGEDGFQPRPLISDFYRVLKTADGYITMLVIGDAEFRGLCEVLEMEQLLDDPRFATATNRFSHFDELLAEAEKRTVNIDTDEVVKRLEEAGVPCGRVNSFDDVLADPRVVHAGSIIEYDHPDGGRMRQARPAAIFDGEPCKLRMPVPRLGQHTDEILASVGCSEAELKSLREAGMIG